MMRTAGKTAKGGRGSAHLIRAFVGFVGFMLSPFTPWNDVFVNVPIALALAIPLSKVVPFPVAYAMSYTFTDVLGIVLMIIAGKGIKLKKRDLIETALWGIVGCGVYLLLKEFI